MPAKTFSTARFLKAVIGLVPGTSRAELSRLQRESSDVYFEMSQVAEKRADEILSGCWEMLGHGFDLRNSIDWHRDPRSEHCWPREFYADLNLAQEPGGGVDVKYVWELGRHQYLAELGRSWLLTGREECAERCQRLMRGWIDANPLFEGIHWTSALEVAMRAISWIWTLAALADWKGWRADDLEQIAGSLADHANYLEHHFSFYSSPYNHLIGEATGLNLISIVLSQQEEAIRWRELSRQVLCEYGPRQFYRDGFCVEQATGYHFYTLGFLSLAIGAARRAGEPMAKLEVDVHRAYHAGALLRQSDGRWPALGDVDSARSIPVHSNDFWDFGSVCALGSVLFDDPELKAASSEPGEETYWLCGCDGLETWSALHATTLPDVSVLDDSGYAVARTGDDWLLFDAGPIADGLHADATPSTAHGHADALQVLYCMNGKPVLIDSGIPFYFGSSEWVKHFRGVASHNTLEIEGACPARHVGQLGWSHVAARPRLDANFSTDAWLARGRAEWSPDVVVERHLLALPGRGIWIADWIQTDRPRTVRWYWHLAAEAMCPEGNGHQQNNGHGNRIQLLTWNETESLKTNIDTAAKDSPVGWESTGFGRLRAGQRLRNEAVVSGSAVFVTFVGTKPICTRIALKGHQVACACPEAQRQSKSQVPAASFADPGDSGVVWQIMNDQTQTTYCAGDTAQDITSGWNPLTGAGNWPAAYSTQTSIPFSPWPNNEH